MAPHKHRFEWHQEKARQNIKRHGVSFEEAITVFGDPLGLSVADPDHSTEEERFVIIGMSARRRILVVYVEWEEAIRIISARPPTRRERNIYEEGHEDLS